MQMPPLPPIDYGRLFPDPDMFSSVDAFRAAGFTVKKRSKAEKVMVATHLAAPRHVFKKFSHSVSCEVQSANYRARVEGAEAIRALIARHRLDRLTVPNKWIYRLPPKFAAQGRCPEMLVAERVDLVSIDESKRRYREIDAATLEQLCRVLHAFRGFDFAVHNMRFTPVGQIAFFDTESWNKSPRPVKRVLKYLSEEFTKESRRTVKRLFDRFDEEEKHA